MRRLRARDPASYARVKQLLEAPMLVLALVFAVALLWPLAADVSAQVAELEARLVAAPAGDPNAHGVSSPRAGPPASAGGEGADAGSDAAG